MTECIIGPYIDTSGYARVQGNGSGGYRYAHRIAWEEINGPILPNRDIHHKCGNKSCINIDHLEMLTPQEHRRLQRKCNHPDTDRSIDANGKSFCRICRREYHRAWRTRRRNS